MCPIRILSRSDINSQSTRHLNTPFATDMFALSLPSFSLVHDGAKHSLPGDTFRISGGPPSSMPGPLEIQISTVKLYPIESFSTSMVRSTLLGVGSLRFERLQPMGRIWQTPVYNKRVFFCLFTAGIYIILRSTFRIGEP